MPILKLWFQFGTPFRDFDEATRAERLSTGCGIFQFVTYPRGLILSIQVVYQPA